MIIVLFLAQVVLVVLQYGSAVIDLSPFTIFLPAMLIAALWGLAYSQGWTVNIDAWPVEKGLFSPDEARAIRKRQRKMRKARAQAR